MKITCAFCFNEFYGNLDAHECSDMIDFGNDIDFYRTEVRTINYSVQSLSAAESFLQSYPEFADLGAKPSRLTGLAYEQIATLTPDNFESDSMIPVVADFAEELTREDEWDSIYELREYDAVMQGVAPWSDVEPTRCTTAFHYWKSDRKVNLMPEGYFPMGMNDGATYVQSYEALDFERPELMRLEFNELKGFASQLLVDADITEKFQFTVFNAYVGRDEKFHIGLLTFDRTNDGQVAVTCKHSGCHYQNTPFFSPVDPSREQMEDFVMACIRHGNNHGPKWLVTRKDFTFIHANNCDATHGTTGHCNANAPRLNINALDTENVDAVFGYLIHHRKFCTSSECRCTHYYHLLSDIVTDHYTKVAA